MEYTIDAEMLNKMIADLAPTQKEVAAKLGVSAPYICDVLAGKRRPGKKILEALGLRAETVYFQS